MIGIDTNVIVRYLTQDDEMQSALANKFIEEQLSENSPGFITIISLVEIVWVLQSCYQIDKSDLCNTIRLILETKQFVTEQNDVCYKALKLFESGNGDFSDAVIVTLGNGAGCSETVTFDKNAQSVGMTLLS